VDNPKQLTHIGLCHGYGGIELGLHRIFGDRLRTSALCEIEAHAIENTLAKMEKGFITPAPLWNDLRTFPWGEFRGKVDILTGGFPCFEAGTLVLTKQRGYAPIETIGVGELVLTPLGNWREVTATMHKTGARTTKVRHSIGVDSFCTGEHPFYARKRATTKTQLIRALGDGKTRKDIRSVRAFSKPEWADASNLGKQYRTGFVFPTERCDSSHTTDFWWLIGRYVACGWRAINNKKGRVVIASNDAKLPELLKRIEKAGICCCVAKERTCNKIHITKKHIYEFCGQFGDGAENKTVPGWVLGIDKEQLRAFVDGYLSGDGHTERGGQKAFTTVSKKLALGMGACACIAYNAPFNLCKHTPKTPTTIIEGRCVHQKPWYRGTLAKTHRRGFVEKGYLWGECKTSEGNNGVTVFNLSVDGDESYIANGAIVHNCQPFSCAGARGGDEDPRHLFPAILAGIRICRPAIVFLENVEGIISAKLAGSGWNDPAGTPVLLHVLRELERVGYRATAGIFSASEVGAPHQRKRVFIMACCEGVDGRGLHFGEETEHPEPRDGCDHELANDDGERIKKFGRWLTSGSKQPAFRNGCVDLWPTRPGQPQHDWEPPRVC